MKKNLDIRIAALEYDLFLKDLAIRMNVNANHFYRDLRSRELTQEEKNRVFEVMEKMEGDCHAES